jgi:hypothetical protein
MMANRFRLPEVPCGLDTLRSLQLRANKLACLDFQHRACRDKQQVVAPQPMNWLQQVTGFFKDKPAFEEVLAYGRAIRQGDESVLEAQDEL